MQFMKLIGFEVRDDGLHCVEFASFLKTDFVARAITLEYTPAGLLQNVRFHSNDFGTAAWSNGNGIANANVWENEDAAITPESQRRFRLPLLNGKTSTQVALKTIIPDVIDYLPDANFRQYVQSVISQHIWESPLPSDFIAQFERVPTPHNSR